MLIFLSLESKKCMHGRVFKGQYFSLHTSFFMDVHLAKLFRKETTVQEALHGEGPELVLNKRAGTLDDKW